MSYDATHSSKFKNSFISTDFLASTLPMLFALCFGIGSILYSLDHEDPRFTNVVFCKVRSYSLQASSMIARWLIMAACIDRYTSTSVHVYLRRFARVHVAHRTIVIITLCWLVIPIHILIFYEIRSNVCAIFSNVPAALYHSIYTMVMGGFLPILTMILCAVGIRHNLNLKRQRRQQQLNGTLNDRQNIANEQQRRLRDRHVLSMLFIQIAVYVVATIPQLTNLLFSAIVRNVPNKSPDRLAIESFLTYLAELLTYLFPATSFYIYSLASHTYRRELVKLLRKIRFFSTGRGGAHVAPTLNIITLNRNQIDRGSTIPMARSLFITRPT